MTNFGEYIRQQREALKITQAEMAKKLGVSRARICDVEKGRQVVRLRNAIQWARTLQICELEFIQNALQDRVDRDNLSYKVTVTASS